MDYEQKYKDALERARKIENRELIDVPDGTSIPVAIFPELKELEDEKIRKELIAVINDLVLPNEQKERFNVWFEKQSCKDSQIILPQFTFDDILALQCCMETVKKVQEDKDLYEKLKDLHGRVYDTYQIEKQSEQKPQGKSALEATNEEEVDNANKVEPKFHKGDFITDWKRVFQIEETVWDRNNRNDGTTYCESLIVNLRDGITYANNTNLKEYHLWTIEDAKDGDVLVSASNQPFIYNGKFTEYTVGAYCGLNVYGVFVVEKYLKESNWTNNDNIRPATKEQRDLLFKEIKETGYKWDANKKIVNKVIIYE